MSSYDPCLLITKNSDKIFGITGLQTDNILNIRPEIFMQKEETEIMEVKFKAKIQTILKTVALRDFNNYRMTIEAEFIMVVQKNQAQKLVLIDIKNNAKK